jgi:ubiquitin-like protein ATG12
MSSPDPSKHSRSGSGTTLPNRPQRQPSESLASGQRRISQSNIPLAEDATEAAAAENDEPSQEPSSEEDDDEAGDLPMSMTASVMLSQLPKDASQALKEIDALDDRKGTLPTNKTFS